MIVLFSKAMQMDGTGLLNLNLLSILDMIELGESRKNIFCLQTFSRTLTLTLLDPRFNFKTGSNGQNIKAV